MNRVDINQALINKIGAKAYLEIGVQGGSCFTAIKCDKKVGVDPDPSSAATEHVTSDDYFNRHNKMDARIEKEMFDVIFIDGLHHADQVEQDILNALDHLNEGGYIVCHDMLPTSDFIQQIPQTPQHCEWTGDCWKAFVRLRQTRDDLEMFVVNTDWGVGVIKRGSQETIKVDVPLTWDNFVIHQQEWMNVISVNDFKFKEGL